jgi:hypothetical protein
MVYRELKIFFIFIFILMAIFIGIIILTTPKVTGGIEIKNIEKIKVIKESDGMLFIFVGTLDTKIRFLVFTKEIGEEFSITKRELPKNTKIIKNPLLKNMFYTENICINIFKKKTKCLSKDRDPKLYIPNMDVLEFW